ncbi:MAG: hypothetical protein LC799_05660 [Actinobacteria bacterium]|nr:hypothetical protein [Actinomycetota bacterium]
MQSESVPTSDALCGADGTQLPDPLPVLPDPLTGPEHSSWRDTPEIPPVPLPPVPDGRAMREAIAAVLGEDPAAPAGTASRSPQTHPQAVPVPGRPPVPTPHRLQVPAPHRPQTSAPPRAFTPIPPPADLRRRIGRESAGPLQSRSSGGVRTGCVIALIIVGVVAFNIIAGAVQSVSALFS